MRYLHVHPLWARQQCIYSVGSVAYLGTGATTISGVAGVCRGATATGTTAGGIAAASGALEGRISLFSSLFSAWWGGGGGGGSCCYVAVRQCYLVELNCFIYTVMAKTVILSTLSVALRPRTTSDRRVSGTDSSWVQVTTHPGNGGKLEEARSNFGGGTFTSIKGLGLCKVEVPH